MFQKSLEPFFLKEWHRGRAMNKVDALDETQIRIDLAAAIRGEPHGSYPTADDGLRSMAAVHQAVASAKADGAWVDARPPMFRD